MPVVVIVAGWIVAFRLNRFGWLAVVTAVLISLPIGLMVLIPIIGAAPPTDPEGGANAEGAVWGMQLLPALLLWLLAAAASLLLPPLAWLARRIST